MSCLHFFKLITFTLPWLEGTLRSGIFSYSLHINLLPKSSSSNHKHYILFSLQAVFHKPYVHPTGEYLQHSITGITQGQQAHCFPVAAPHWERTARFPPSPLGPQSKPLHAGDLPSSSKPSPRRQVPVPSINWEVSLRKASSGLPGTQARQHQACRQAGTCSLSW